MPGSTSPRMRTLLFDTPLEDRWRAAGRLLGVNLMQTERRSRSCLRPRRRREASGRGVVLAFDYGDRRIGVAVGQTVIGTAPPVVTLPARGAPTGRRRRAVSRTGRPSRLLVGAPL